ncbi:MAG TPA: peptidoglycan-binding protein [Vicinamibacterales bacterium]|nr:peptidoglycan-binding protein [Vicinamibacterales bacterium]
MNDLQKRTAQAIVNIFETGRAGGDYGAVTLLKNDAGHLTYGRSQTTLASGNLFLLIKAYCERPDARAETATALSPFLPALARPDLALDTNMTLREALREAGDDPAMVDEQDRFFDRQYLNPACSSAAARGITTALGQAIVYDSKVHGSFERIAARVGSTIGPGADDEKAWVTKYVSARDAWLRNHPNTLLRKTVYRTETFSKLIQESKWDLPLDLKVRGVSISPEVLGPPIEIVRATAVDPDEVIAARVLHLATPYLRGDDVKRVQTALKTNGFDNSCDGVYGPFTAALVKRFQAARTLTVDGVVGPTTRTALGL